MEISHENESNTLFPITELKLTDYKNSVTVEISLSDKIEQSKGVIYIQKYNSKDFTDLSEKLIGGLHRLNLQRTT